jgi:hypothetical protein
MNDEPMETDNLYKTYQRILTKDEHMNMVLNFILEVEL